MKKAIRQTLRDHVPALEQIVFHANEVDPQMNAPYAIILDANEVEDAAWSGYRSFIDVEMYCPTNHELTPDILSAQVVNALEAQIIRDPPNGQAYAGLYRGTVGQDQAVSQTLMILRRVRFAITALQPVHEVSSSTSEDDWLKALASATETWLGSSWACYFGAWPSDYHIPAVLWKLTEVESREVGVSVYEVRKKFVGHVLGASPNEQANGVFRIGDMLAQAIKLPLNEQKKQYVTIKDPRTNLQADAVSEGQITVTLSRKLNRVTETAPFMQEIRAQSNLR
ncbi:hypothetical protein E0485_23070 [Paenibacillus albiflavus]|uniref:Uncharacterized protein n=1 Tax=Paenibacillus albiflavus TaxID=2545760 RepID=A0A4R4DYQ7_9BACL|nr:hypothetical protein [Paenibacillus albiflavus]TCZ70972.1 hypothetical protein E0485_23070 [Paenibacillus albiflavus]